MINRQKISVFLWLALMPSFAWTTDPVRKIRWDENHRLTWEYFQGAIDPNRNPNTQAVAKVMIELKTNIIDFQVQFEVNSYFAKDGSWTINTTSNHILNHEQIHFDISELFARKLRKRLNELQGLTHRNIQQKVNAVYQEILSAHDAFQQRYDRETNHSNHHRKQEEWNEMVQNLLDKYSAFANPFLTTTIDRRTN
ncbi:MAG TPA: DUF922 domain-containing protein [Bacteroidales bacterium]|nr:DUF922 domain-containing protein [Bacteroidales bacterium]